MRVRMHQSSSYMPTWFDDQEVLALYIAVSDTSEDKSSDGVLYNKHSRQEIDVRTFSLTDELCYIGHIRRNNYCLFPTV